MTTITIERVSVKNPIAVWGVLMMDETPVAVTLERPWLNNEHAISCIPKGTYQADWVYSPIHSKFLYQLQAVPGRGQVELHTGNDVLDSEGCILIGTSFGPVIEKDKNNVPTGRKYIGILDSIPAYSRFVSACKGEKSIQVIITEPV